MLDDKDRASAVAAILSSLHTAYDLQIHVKLAHWNVRGIRFFEVHQEADRVYAELGRCVDDLAERIMQLGEPVRANATELEEGSALAEWPSSETDGDKIIGMLADSLAVLADELGKSAATVRDLGDLVSGHVVEHCQMIVEKIAGFFKAANDGRSSSDDETNEDEDEPAPA